MHGRYSGDAPINPARSPGKTRQLSCESMVKDSKKYAATGGWGFADFTNGKPAMRRCIKRASPATRLQKIPTTFSLTTHHALN